MKFIAIKIKIRRDPATGANVHPPGHDGYEIDGHGIGMHYDDSECCDWDANGYRYAVTALPEDRAKAYIARADGLVEALSEAEAETWFAQHKRSEAAERFDLTTLQAVKLKKELGIALSKEDEESLDPNHPRPGIVKARKGFRAKLPKDATL